jgi:hypothetical protein
MALRFGIERETPRFHLTSQINQNAKQKVKMENMKSAARSAAV